VADLLFKNRFHGLPVVDKSMVVGIITEDDFFLKGAEDLYLPSYIDFLEKNKIDEKSPKEIKEKVKKLLNATAQDLMSPRCVTVRPDTDIEVLFALIQKTKFTTFPVTDDQNNLIGLITLVDLLGQIKSQRTPIGSLANVITEQPRELDMITTDLQSFWQRSFVYIEKTHVKTWTGVFILAFIAGLMAMFLWTVSISIQSK
jgi:CBS domain-containing protein